MKLTLVLLIVCLLAVSPMLVAMVQMVGVPVSDGIAFAADNGGDEESMSMWDWWVLYWTTHLDDWPW